MGRSVSYPSDCSHVSYRTQETSMYGYCNKCDCHTPVKDVDGDSGFCMYCNSSVPDVYFDQALIQDDWDDFKGWVQETAKTNWKSLEETEKWLGREDLAILENELCYIGISEYCGLIALWIKPKDATGYETDNLARRWCDQIAPKFERTFGKYNKLGTFSNGESVYEIKE